jgi:hypothetical protein
MKYVTVITAFLLITSCVNQGSEKKTGEEEEIIHKAQSEVVTLDNGEKWKANFATTKGIMNMKYLVETINEESNIDDYRKLSENLQKEFQHIFQRCDMTGEAHNQLHNYLHPMLGWFDTFKEGDVSQCQSAATAFNKHLEKYDSYFK